MSRRALCSGDLGFEMAFIFKYSIRSGTLATRIGRKIRRFPTQSELFGLYEELADCLHEGALFRVGSVVLRGHGNEDDCEGGAKSVVRATREASGGSQRRSRPSNVVTSRTVQCKTVN